MPDYTHRNLCEFAAKWLLDQSWSDAACVELKLGRSFADAVGVCKARSKKRRVTIVECKRTRSDLLQDIRKRKYMKYERNSTHCYFAGTSEAYKSMVDKQILFDFKNRGVPDHWGILHIDAHGKIRCIRKARAHKTITSAQVNSIVRKIARSLSYRILQEQK
jgi:hypothetical protein